MIKIKTTVKLFINNSESNNDRRSWKSNKSDVSSTPKTPYKSESKAEIVFDQKEKSKNLFNSVINYIYFHI